MERAIDVCMGPREFRLEHGDPGATAVPQALPSEREGRCCAWKGIPLLPGTRLRWDGTQPHCHTPWCMSPTARAKERSRGCQCATRGGGPARLRVPSWPGLALL